jgi:5-oxoprolinase (ATP-hydrolysing) subunit A
MFFVDLNCDMGEGFGNEAEIMPYISSANIACGFHAGDLETIMETILLAKKNQVAIGAHLSFPDRENFGRTEMQMSDPEVRELVLLQVEFLSEMARVAGESLRHVKPHGALYNMSAKKPMLAEIIATAIKDFDPGLVLFGLSGSYSISEARSVGLSTASEVFADRTYQDNGNLTLRIEPNALIEDVDQAVQQALQMVREGTVTSVSGKKIPVTAETICIHSDGKFAVEFARKIHEALKKEGVTIKRP